MIFIEKIIKQKFAKIFNFEDLVNLEIYVALLMANMSFVSNQITMIYIRLKFASHFLFRIFVLMVIDVSIYTNFLTRPKSWILFLKNFVQKVKIST